MITSLKQEIGAVDEKSAYWNTYYGAAKRGQRPIPSQFATFVCNEARDTGLVIDLACGTGRDSFFFGQYFPNVLGVDGAHTAIAACNDTAKVLGAENVRFCEQDIADTGFSAFLSKEIVSQGEASALIYARFFLHAITDEEQTALFEGVAAALRPGDRFALEYRTIRDASGRKETAEHYRRFVTAAQTDIALSQFGFTPEYSVEGFGLAKYKHDDAYVARAIYIKE